MAVSYLGYGLLGLLLAALWLNVTPFATIFLLAPLLVARSAFNNYAQLREAYDSTVRALCQAVETKDYYTRGHSERVARVTEMVAREWGMREDRVQVVRYAGMLHDVGKLGVPTRVLQKQGKLNQLEFEAIKLHPLRGKEMLGEIQFLDEAMAGIMHHHERMDGRGYPLGLMGDEIPEFARLITVADAFDSMTSTRSYREAKTVDAAIAEIERCAGTQFDPRVVACLVRAVEKHGWQPTPESYFGPQVDADGAPINREAPGPVAAALVPEPRNESHDVAHG
ncbi:MAG: HD-GYP domain-containing protein, partial [Mycobacteriales bacterium]